MLKPSAEVVVLPSGMTSAVAEAMVTAVRYRLDINTCSATSPPPSSALTTSAASSPTPPAAPTPRSGYSRVWSQPRGKLLAVIVLAAREHALLTAT